MAKTIKWKTITEFLKKEYPENLQPIRKIAKKQKKIIEEKIEIFKKVKKRIKEIEKKEIENLIVIKEKNHSNENSWIFLKNSFFLDRGDKRGKENKILLTPGKIGKNQKPTPLKKENKKNNFSILLSFDQINSKVLKKRIQYKIVSEFLMKLKEKKKVNILYGNISKNFFEKAYIQSWRLKGKMNENLLIQFEMRLDVLLYRICFCKTIYGAKQVITHNFVTVNGNIVNIPSYQVQSGDIISINRANLNPFGDRLLKDYKIYLCRRQFRFLISFEFLLTNLKNDSHDFHNSANQLKSHLHSLNLLINISKKSKNHPYSRKSGPFNAPFKKKKTGVKRQQVQLNFHKNLQKFQLLKKINYLNQLLNFNIKNQPFLKLHNHYLKKKILLKIKYYMRLKRSQQNLLNAMRICPLKPLHVEVSYKLLTAVVLFSPQKLAFPTLLNLDLFVRSLAK